MKINWKQVFLDYLFIAIGTLVLAVSLNIFLAPNKISGGGVSSIGTVLLHLFKVPLSVTNITFNAVLFAAGYKFLGKGAVLKRRRASSCSPFSCRSPLISPPIPGI